MMNNYKEKGEKRPRSSPLNQKLVEAKIIDIGSFKAFYFESNPPRIESAVSFNSQLLGQKMIFQMMDISWRHGLGCSAPQFDEQGNVIFAIGTVLPTKTSLNKFKIKLRDCLEEITNFANEFARQLDFTVIDVSMFVNINPDILDFSYIAAVRDQKYGGNWNRFLKALNKTGNEEDVDIVKRCKEFEEINKRDIGLVGSKVLDLLAIMDSSSSIKIGKN
jgi:hypothetical protein